MRTSFLLGMFFVFSVAGWTQAPMAGQTRIIEVLADKDSRYKIAGQKTPEISVKAGEQIVLRITARKGRSWNRDGSGEE